MNNIKKIKRCSVLQHDSSDCGVACLVSVIKFFGGYSDIDDIRKLSGTTQTGTSMLGLYQAACSNGLDATGYEASVEDLQEFNGVVILHVTIENNLEHFILSFGYENGKFTLWDPAKGIIFLSKDELREIWLSKKCLSLVPNNSFMYTDQDKRTKFHWILNSINPERNYLIISIAIGVIISLLGLVMAVFTQKLIDEILPTREVKLLIIVSVLAFILLCSRIFISAIRQVLLLMQGKYFNIRIVDDFYSSLLNLPKSFFDTRKRGDFVARMNDTMRIQKVISDVAGVYAIDILILIITLAVLFYYSSFSAVLSLVCLPVLYFISRRLNSQIIEAQQSLMSGYATSESYFIDSLGGIQEIKSLNWQDFFFARNNKIYTEFQTRIYNLGKIKLKLSLITGLAGTLFMMAVLLYASLEVINYRITQGELMAILTLSSTMLPSVLNLALIDIPLNEAKVALNRMFEFTRIKPEQGLIENDSGSLDIRKLELRDISFRFPGRGLLLQKINITLEIGKLISLIGECGSGKSTLANIILRFYDPDSGEIVINDEINSTCTGLKTWRSKVGIIPQEIHIFNGTILQNILSDISEDNFKEMASTISHYGLNDYIKSFPAGLLTLVGEEGINLSGGEKQILGFIRILIHKPDILIIDEGTSSMDSVTESRIIELLNRLKKEMGILLISHRMNLIRVLSDEIYILEDRSIRGRGTHEDLMGTSIKYRQFCGEPV
jgi:ATP-binding cassette, subfamily C, bacteriocin exporter